jgi:hypothetical protein
MCRACFKPCLFRVWADRLKPPEPQVASHRSLQ